MIADFDDFCLWMYVVIDERWERLAPLFRRPGPAPACSESQRITMAIGGPCRGWDVETELVSPWHDRRDVLPAVPERSRFNRRLRKLLPAIKLIRQAVVQRLDIAQDRQGTIASVPIPVVQFHLVPRAARAWAVHGATVGSVVPKQQTMFGYKLHRLVTLKGVILDFVLAPAQLSDLTVGAEVLSEHTALVVRGDKGDVSQPVATRLAQHNRLARLPIPRRNQKRQLPEELARLLNAQRQILETVHDQLTEQFGSGSNHAHRFWGLCTRLSTKLTAHTKVYLNRLFGNVNCLQIKRLAFPN